MGTIMSLFLVCTEQHTKSLPSDFIPLLLLAVLTVFGILFCFTIEPKHTEVKRHEDKSLTPTEVTERDIDEIVFDKKNERVGFRKIHERTIFFEGKNSLIENSEEQMGYGNKSNKNKVINNYESKK